MNFQEVRQKYPQYDDLNDIQLASALHKKYYADMPFPKFADQVGLTALEEAKARDEYSPTKGMSTTDKLLAGAGKAFTDIGRGSAQLIGLGPTRADVDETKRLDAPLMDTKAGMVGNIGGNVAAALPAAFIPGANTAVGSTLIGAGLSALQPVGTKDSRALNTFLGAGFGYGGHQLGAKGIPAAINWAKSKVASKAAERTANAARDATIAEARQAGFVLPPSEVKPGVVSNLLERWAGKASVGQQASLKNQQVTNKLVRQTLGLPDDAPITPEALEPVKQAAWSVYNSTRKLGTITADQPFETAINDLSKVSTKLNPVPGIDDLVGRLKQGSFDADDLVTAIQTFKANASTRLGPTNLDPVSKNLGKAEAKAAAALEDLLERNLGGTVLQDFKNARVTLGKVGTVERAMVESTGDVSARKLAAQLSKGKPLSGDMKTAAKFAQAFPKLTQQNVNPVPGGSPLDAMAAIGASAATSNPAWLSLALGRPAARSAALSPMFAGAPNYSPGITAKTLPYLLEPLNNRATAQGMGLLGPSIYAAQQ